MRKMFVVVVVLVFCVLCSHLYFKWERLLRLEQNTMTELHRLNGDTIFQCKIIGYKVVEREFDLLDLCWHTKIEPVFALSELPKGGHTYRDMLDWTGYVKELNE